MAQRTNINIKFANFCNRRANLYREYADLYVEDMRIRKNVKLAKYNSKLQKSLDEVKIEFLPKEAQRFMSVDKELEKYQKKLRMKYRVEREKVKRQIAKQQKREALLSSPEFSAESKTIGDLKALAKDKIGRKIAATFVKKDFDAEALNKKLEDILTLHAQMVEERKQQLYAQFEEWYNSKTHDLQAAKEKKEALQEKIRIASEAYEAKLEVALTKEQNAYVKRNYKRIAQFEKLEKEALGRVKETTAKVEELDEDTVLSVKNLSMHFGGLRAVDELDFDVKKGEIFGLIGPNGAGKTTVFNCITQFYKPTAGELRFKQKDGKTISLTDYVVHDIILKGIARTFQNVEVVKEVSVLENLLIAATRQYSTTIPEQMLHLPILKKEERIIRMRAEKVLDYMNLSAYRDRWAFGLPYGILKRIEIARVLMCNPQLIILDEPAAGLNESETQELAELIRKIAKDFDCTVLLVEHDMGLVMNVCDHICAISFGRKLAFGTPEEVQASKEVQEAYLGVGGDE